MNTMDMLECKVVNIIQEHVLQAHVIYCIMNMKILCIMKSVKQQM